MRKHFWDILSVVLAVLILAVGFVSTRLFDVWTAPPEQTVRVDLSGTQALRLDNGEELLLPPLQLYRPEACVPAKESEPFRAALEQYQEQELKLLLCDYLNIFLLSNTQAALRPDKDLFGDMVYQEDCGLFFLLDYPLDPGRLDLVLNTDLLSYCSVAYCNYKAPLQKEYSVFDQQGILTMLERELKNLPVLHNRYGTILNASRQEPWIALLHDFANMLDYVSYPPDQWLPYVLLESLPETLGNGHDFILYGDSVLCIFNLREDLQFVAFYSLDGYFSGFSFYNTIDADFYQSLAVNE